MGRPEDARVKIPALVHFTRLGYTYREYPKVCVNLQTDVR